MKKSLLSFALFISMGSLFSQTVMIDYAEKINEDKATIHYLEPKGEPDSEEFASIIEGKKKLLAILESYRADGFELMTSNVTTHKHKRSMHYHYQYILQNSRQAPMRPPEPGQTPFGKSIRSIEQNDIRQNDSPMGGSDDSNSGFSSGGSVGGGGSSTGGSSSQKTVNTPGKATPPPPPPPPLGREDGSEESAKPSNTDQSAPSGKKESGGSSKSGSKVPNPSQGSIMTGPQ